MGHEVKESAVGVDMHSPQVYAPRTPEQPDLPVTEAFKKPAERLTPQPEGALKNGGVITVDRQQAIRTVCQVLQPF